MTDEQVEDLFLQIERLHPTEEKEVLRDLEYSDEEEARRGVLWDDMQVEPFDAASPPPQGPSSSEEWEELTPYGWDKLGRQSLLE